jgi:phospholipid/cholesterol/gamma-HCH transport system substrate-binding protein
VKKAIKDHLRDFAAMIGLVVMAVGIGGYILSNQRLRFPVIQDTPFKVYVDVRNARGVIPGQGQTVRVAGMRVGDIGEVELHEGRARVRMDLDREHEGLVKEDATVLLRPRTGLKDMFIALDPGSDSARPLEEGDVVPISSSAPDVNADEVLEALDADTRAYLKLLIHGAGRGLADRRHDLREVFARLGPLHRDLRVLNTEVVKRKRNLRRLISNYGSTMERLGREDRALTSLVRDSGQVFSRLARQDQRISETVSRLPSTLEETENTLGRVRELGQVARPAFRALRPAVRELDEANQELRPLAEVAEPVLRRRIRPFVREARPFVENVRPAARDLGRASPDLRSSFFQLNRLFNMAAYNPGGKESLTGDQARDRRRDEGFLFWLGWVSHNSNLTFNTGDAQGPFRRFLFSATCSTYTELLKAVPGQEEVLKDAFDIRALLADTELCP